MRKSYLLLSALVVLFLVVSAKAQSYTNTVFPQLAFGGGWSVDFSINNQGLGAAAGLQLAFFDDNGAPLVVNSNIDNAAVLSLNFAPGETKTIRASLPGNNTVAGYAVLRRPFPSAVTATMVVRFKSGSQVLTQLGLPQQYTAQSYSFPVEVDGSNSVNTGIAIANATFGSSSAKAQTFVVSLLSADGKLQDMTTVSLPLGGHVSMMINDPRLFPNLTSFSGTACISAGIRFGFLALRLENAALGTVAVNQGAVLPASQLLGTPLAEAEPNDSRSQSQAIIPPTLISGSIGTSTDQDYFSFSGKQGDIITVMAETDGMNSALDTVVTLQDSSGATVASNDQNLLYAQNDSFLQLVLPADGAYHVRVTAYGNNQGGANFIYRLHLTKITSGPQPQEPTIQSLSPAQASPGSSFTLTINGSRLTGATAITFSPSTGITVSNIQSSLNQVTASVSISSGAATGTRQVSVTTPSGTSNAVVFTVGQTPTNGYDGSWVGTTGQGKVFSFKISGNALTEVNYAGSLSGGGCSMDFSGKTTTNITLGGTEIDFSITNSAPYAVSLDVAGSFTSTSQASGTVKLTVNPPPPGQPGCSGWVSTTWSATKQ